MGYLLDANVMIAAQNLHYGFDFMTPFQMLRLESARFVLESAC